MALILSCECERRRKGDAVGGRYLRAGAGKSSKSSAFRSGKIIPAMIVTYPQRLERGTRCQCFHWQHIKWRKGMYIGLGGILVLILILWLLGVI
jgi:hypothetical protein